MNWRKDQPPLTGELASWLHYEPLLPERIGRWLAARTTRALSHEIQMLKWQLENERAYAQPKLARLYELEPEQFIVCGTISPEEYDRWLAEQEATPT